VSEEQFREMCKAHDLTFEYSDDSNAYNRGREQLAAIKEAAEQLPLGVAEQIWNQVISEKILPEYVAQYTWPGLAR
jgi:hypothetical protein